MARHSLACGIVSNQAGEKELVAAGGRGSVVNVVEIYSIASDMWTIVNPLPAKIDNAAAVQYGDSFVMLGGIVGTTNLKTIYKYNKNDDCWTLLDAELEKREGEMPLP